MTPSDPGHAFLELRKLAKERYGGNTDALIVLYAVEGFLRRLAASPFADQLVLKGGILMAAQGARRVTRDADLSAHGLSNDEALLGATVASIAALSATDGLQFDVGSIATEIMREDAANHGVRVKLDARLATAKAKVALDVSFGDPGTQIMVTLPGLLGDAVELAAYPIELSLAEKIATMMSRADTNTRDRDFADVWVLSRQHQLPADELHRHLHTVAEHRGHPLVPLARALEHMPNRQSSYTRMLARNAYERTLPEQWTDLLDELKAFVDPLITSPNAWTSWDPIARSWS
jgi:predicted nucleotidyltransferase component of viral defense system